MRKYGIEHFHIELIEETDDPEEREEYWIQQLGTYKYGYNATMGGDGKRYLDYDKIYELYLQGKLIQEIAEICHYNKGYVSEILRQHYNVTKKEIQDRATQHTSKKIAKIDKDTGEILEIFPSKTQASISVGKGEQGSRHIREVCNHQRKTAYGYKWEEITT